jgi:excisionase family DNA binding protein
MPFTDAYLTVNQVADQLGYKNAGGVYKLIQRKQLPALKLSPRKTVIARWALDAYKERHGLGDIPIDTVDVEDARERFRVHTRRTPEEWVQAWKTGEIEDSGENMTLLVRAVSLRNVSTGAGEPGESAPTGQRRVKAGV